MSNLTEFTTGEVCAATLHMPHDPGGGESVTEPLHIGFYPAEGADPEYHEIWIEQDGKRVQFYARELPVIVKQLRRAASLCAK